MQIAQVPSIEQQPRTVADTALHYGYVAYNDIYVGDRKVQPAHSPYYQVIPARQLIPFTNIEVAEPNPKVTSSPSHVRTAEGKDPSVVFVPKPARQCAFELENAYAGWGFKILYPLTGFSSEDAFKVFQAIQPFAYKLADILSALEDAESRIASTTSYEVSYEGDKVKIEPLTSELRKVAKQVLPLIIESAERAVNEATDIKNSTIQKMEQFYATGSGKKAADPLDKRIFDDLKEEIPVLLGKKPSDGLDRLAEILSQRESGDIAQLRADLTKELAELRELKEDLAKDRANKDKMAQVRAARTPVPA